MRPAVSPIAERTPDLRAMLAEQHAAEPDRLPWPDEWFERTDSGHAQVCLALWRKVLLSCILSSLDIAGQNDKRNCKSVRGFNMSWFRSRDFHTICALAGFDGVAVSDRLTDPARRPAIIAALIGNPRGGASHKIKREEDGA